MKKYLVCSLLCFLICNLSLCAQTDEQILLSEVEETIVQQCRHRLKALTDHMEKIASKIVEDSIKDYHIEACLDLFVGKGNSINDDENNMIIPAPRIEVSLMPTGRTFSYFIKDYLLRLKHLRHSKITVKALSCYYLNKNSKKKVGENKYSVDFYVYNFSIEENGDEIVYRDKIRKPVRIIIETGQSFWIPDILLGNIKVNQISEFGQ